MPSLKAKPSTIDEFLADVNAQQRAVLQKLRRTIHAAAPRVEECIGYGLAAFRLNGRLLVAFGAWKNHCALYPMSSRTAAVFQEELKNFEPSKGTIRFTTDKPLPAALVKKLVKARIAENVEKEKERRRGAPAKAAEQSAKPAAGDDVSSVLAILKRLSKPRIREEMSLRYGIVTRDAFGVRMSDMQQVARRLGRNHGLALALWKTGNYEARTVAGFIAEPGRITPALMDHWCRDFDNWAICDTLCFHLFDRTPRAFAKVAQWAGRRGEFQKRAAFALLACVALHDKSAVDESFTRCLPLIEAAAKDERNFVKKAVSWALRAIGGHSTELHASASALARRLATATDPTSRWIGRDALRALSKKAP